MSKNKLFKHIIAPKLLCYFVILLKYLPMSLRSKIGSLFGSVCGKFLTSSTKQIISNLSVIKPFCRPESSKYYKNIIHMSWKHIGRVIFESLSFSKDNKEKIKSMILLENFNPEDLEQPAVYISAHFGNWELLSRIPSAYDIDITFLYKKTKNKILRKLIDDIRDINNTESNISWVESSISPVKSIRKLMKDLSKGRAVGMLIDQVNSFDDQTIDFFSKKIKCTYLPAFLALKFNISLFIVHNFYDGKIYRIKLNKIEPQNYFGVDTKIAAKEITKIIYKNFEEWIKEHPEQWLSIYRYW
ncbi:lysophospholipid acyltransferase family protein [Lyticum sinuosum]|uniref:Lysophospholipid acyltransferase n=1 Tax=Lyticum sinuosum TaxID=1332059 RepID=A0AAE5AH31_9RICK|nr:hypothetical protein [Lyticum sinuosum]MDZ5761522.1 Lysophospholipid acyltransferase [Lyticum sinuosum]